MYRVPMLEFPCPFHESQAFQLAEQLENLMVANHVLIVYRRLGLRCTHGASFEREDGCLILILHRTAAWINYGEVKFT